MYNDDKGDNFDAAALQLAEYYTAIVSPYVARMLRHFLLTKIALFEANATYEALKRVPTTHHAPSLFEQRLEWDAFCDRHATRVDFQTEAHLDVKASFDKLLSFIRRDLVVDDIKARS